MNRKQITEFIVTSLAKYPYIIAFAICMAINPFFYCSTEYIPNNTIHIFNVVIITIATLTGYIKYKSKEIGLFSFIIFVFLEIFSIFYASYKFLENDFNKEIFIFVGLCLFLFILYFSADKSKYKQQITSLLIMSLSFSLCFFYVLGTSISKRQNDAWYFSREEGKRVDKGGHVSYIRYIQNNYSLPQGDVRETWQYAHPPLHHIICAIWLEINEKIFKIDKSSAEESLQILSLFYVICIIISAYKIFRFFKLTGIPFYCSLITTCFFPAFILFSGSINNDVLSVAFLVGVMLSALYWKKDPTIKNILITAICLGLGMMTKISVGVIAPALFILFVSSFIKNANKKYLLKQFLIFLIVSIPLGTWFGIKNYIKYNIPFNFVHSLDTVPDCKPQYVGDKPFLDRLSDFSWGQFDSIFVQNKQWGYNKNDYNPIIVLMKSALFGEFVTNNDFRGIPEIIKIAELFFIIFVFITIITIFSIFYNIQLCLKNNMFVDELFFMFIFFISLVLSLIIHSYNGPYMPFMAFRFITPTVIIGQLFSGLFYQNSNILQTKHRNIISSVFASSFVICSVIFFIGLIISNNMY